MYELVRELEAYSNEMWLNQPKDIDRMLSRNGACGSNFTIIMFARTDAQSASNTLYQLYSLAQSEEGDLETLRRFSAELLSFLGMRVKNYYSMDTTHVLSLRSAVLVRQAKTYQELAEILRAIQRYYGQLAYWIDFAMPWKGLSEEYDRLIAAGAAAEGI